MSCLHMMQPTHHLRMNIGSHADRLDEPEYYPRSVSARPGKSSQSKPALQSIILITFR